MAIKLTGEQEVTRRPLVSLEQQGPSVPDEFAQEQAAKLHLALGEDSPGIEGLSNSVRQGHDHELKKLLARKNELQQIEARNSILNDIFQASPEHVTPEMIQVVQGLTDMELKSPNLGTIIEENYAKLYTNLVAAEIDNDIIEDSLAADPEGTMELLDRHERVAAKFSLVETEAAKLEKEVSEMSILDTVWNWGERMVPFVEWYQKMNLAGKESDFVSSVLPGNNLQEQYAYLWGLPDIDAFHTEFLGALNEIKSRNPLVAKDWVDGFFSYGNTDAVKDNLFDAGMSVADVAPLGILSKALKGSVRGVTKNPLKPWKAAKDLGKYDKVADGKLIDDLKEGTFLPDNIKNIEGLEDSVPTIAAPDRLMTGREKLPAEVINRLKESFARDAEIARRFLTEPNLVQRLEPEELLQHTDYLREKYVRENPSIRKNVIDVEVSQTPDMGNVYQAKIILGRRDGTLFESAKEAETYFKRWVKGESEYEIVPAEGVVKKTAPKDLDHFAIEQRGQGFQIVIPKTVDETSLMNLRLSTGQKTPESFANTVLANLRSGTYLVSKQQETARSLVTTSAEKMNEIFNELARPIANMPKKEYEELFDLMDTYRDQPRFETVEDFMKGFYDKFSKNPTEAQIEGYLAASRIHDVDLMARDLDVYKQKAILGLEQISVRVGDADLSFEGKVIDDLPFGSKEEFTYAILEDGKFKTRSSRFAAQGDRDKVQKLKDQGYKIVQAAESQKVADKKYAEYLLVPEMKRGRVGVKNFERRPELGHKIDTYRGYIKQGKITKGDTSTLYRGDTTLFGVRTDKEGKELVDLFEQARLKTLNNEPDALKFVRDQLGIPPKRWLAAITEGTIDLNVPFAYTPKGVRAADTGVYSNLPNFRDVTKSEHNLSGKIMGRYLGERDQSAIDVLTSEGDMKFEVGRAEYLNPMESLRASTKNMISVRLMNDYTIMTNRNFKREFGDILDATREELEASGVSYLLDPKFKAGADPVRVQMAKNVSTAYRNLLNYGTQFDRAIDSYLERITEKILPKSISGRQQWDSPRKLPLINKPDVFLRTFAFDLRLGMFNPVHYFVQLNGVVNVVGIAGMQGLRGAATYPIMRAAMISNNPAVWERAAKAAENVGIMSKGDFLESFQMYRRSGFHQIGNDYATLDIMTTPELKNKKDAAGRVRKVIDYGRTPFQEGERAVRISAWNAAYNEVKRAKKGAPLTRRDEAEILRRAKLLAGDMTRESNAPWQKGYAAVMTQFWGYQARIMEQFLGKRLTGIEKARLFAAYSAVYGLPVGLGATTGFIPWRDVILDMAAANGWDVNDTMFEPFVDGLASTFWETFIGEEVNIASRYGPGGLPTFYDLLKGDAEFYELFMGASGSILADTVGTIKDAVGPTAYYWASLIADFDGGYYNVTADDWVKVLRNISTVDNAYKLWQVYNAGIWASKNGTNLAEMDLPEGIIAALTGLQPARIEDAFRAKEGAKKLQDWQNSKRKWAIREAKKIFKMDDGPEKDALLIQLKTEMLSYGFSVKQISNVWEMASSEDIVTDKLFEDAEKVWRRYNSRTKPQTPVNKE